MSRIELVGVQKSFGAVRAVFGVSLAVQSGELVALVGPSGCGKTTLLRMIAGFERPDAGDIRFDGHSVLGEPPETRRVGIVFQEHALFPHMSVAQNVGYGLRFGARRSRRERDERILAMLKLVGLSGMEQRAPHELSTGQQQRVALARAIAPSPSLLLLDEPLSSLDAPLREELRLQISRLHKELGITTIHVTHDQEEALAIADRVALMHDGRIEQFATPQLLYERPETEFAARFIGRGNVLNGTVAAVAGDSATVQLSPDVLVEIAVDSVPVRPGERVGVLVRPGSFTTGTARRNHLGGSVAGVDYTGEGARLRVHAPFGEIVVHVPPAQAAKWRDRTGTKVTVSFDPGDARLLRP